MEVDEEPEPFDPFDPNEEGFDPSYNDEEDEDAYESDYSESHFDTHLYGWESCHLP
jgi:hypothetical protein